MDYNGGEAILENEFDGVFLNLDQDKEAKIYQDRAKDVIKDPLQPAAKVKTKDGKIHY